MNSIKLKKLAKNFINYEKVKNYDNSIRKFGSVGKVETYQEVKTERENWILKSIGNHHMQPTHTPYLTKEWLQPKRYKTHLLGTTYVYDFSELFCQAIRIQWNRASHHN